MNKSLALLASLALASGLVTARAATHDLAADFSHVANPSGVWSYGQSTSFGGAFTAFTNRPVDAGVLYWNDDDIPPDVPMIYFNPTSSALVAFPGAVIEGQTAGFHPGVMGEVATYRFTAPAAGVYKIVASFFGQDPDGTSSQVGIALDGVVDPALIAVTGFGAASTQAYQRTYLLNSGSTLDFSVGDGGTSTTLDDATGLTLTITAVPESETYALMLAGLGVVAFAARRQRGGRKP